MRRRLLLVALAVPFAVPAITHGCSDELPFESVCDWLNDPANCYRDFHEEMLAAARPDNPDNPSGDCRTYPPLPLTGVPTEASGVGPGNSNGSFLMRAMLDTCILNAGGSVVFTPPIDLTMFPPSIFADPITYAISLVNADGNECGNLTYTSPHGFSVTIDPPPDAGATAVMDAGVSDAATPPSGTYTQVIAPGRDAFDVTCPTGETHHFNLDEVIGPPGEDGGATSSCAALVNVLPSASLQIYLGGVDTPGAVSFAITYPQQTNPPDLPYIPDGGNLQDAGVLADPAVVYFNCAIPAAAETCADGVKSGFETDVDCGGPQIPSMQQCGACPARCEMGQQCICDDDCDVGAGLACTVNTMSGMRQCLVLDGGVGTQFHICGWPTDAGLPCDGGP
jgi:hypothetical protein